jgi:charged multivesicular body protein 4
MQQELVQAKLKSQKGDKNGALAHLKRKKMYEKEVGKINAGILNLEQQVLSIESSSVTVDIVNAMKTGKNAMQTITQQINVDDVTDLQDDIAELQQQQEQINEVISTPLAGMDADEDELANELAELETAGLEEELSALPSVPVAAAKAKVPAAKSPAGKSPLDALPAAPKHTPAMSEEEKALAELEAEMAA